MILHSIPALPGVTLASWFDHLPLVADRGAERSGCAGHKSQGGRVRGRMLVLPASAGAAPPPPERGGRAGRRRTQQACAPSRPAGAGPSRQPRTGTATHAQATPGIGGGGSGSDGWRGPQPASGGAQGLAQGQALCVSKALAGEGGAQARAAGCAAALGAKWRSAQSPAVPQLAARRPCCCTDAAAATAPPLPRRRFVARPETNDKG